MSTTTTTATALTTSDELRVAVREALVATNDLLGLAFFDAMTSLGIKLELDPTRTVFDKNAPGGPTIYMSNNIIRAYSDMRKDFLVAPAKPPQPA